MHYRTYPPPSELTHCVRFFWSLESDVIGASPHRLTADPCPGLVLVCTGRFTEADGSSTPAGHLAGHTDTFTDNLAIGPFSLFGVYLWPWGARLLFGGSHEDHMRRFIGIDALWGAEGADLVKRVLRCEGHAERMALLTEQLKTRLLHADAPDPVLAPCVQRILTEQAATPLDVLMKNSGLARRQFERRFKECTGFPPALFVRMVRFQRSYRMLENGEAASLTEMAHACGYFDQSHFIRDFKRFSGMNPRTYFEKAPEKVDNFVRLPER